MKLEGQSTLVLDAQARTACTSCACPIVARLGCAHRAGVGDQEMQATLGLLLTLMMFPRWLACTCSSAPDGLTRMVGLYAVVTTI